VTPDQARLAGKAAADAILAGKTYEEAAAAGRKAAEEAAAASKYSARRKTSKTAPDAESSKDAVGNYAAEFSLAEITVVSPPDGYFERFGITCDNGVQAPTGVDTGDGAARTTKIISGPNRFDGITGRSGAFINSIRPNAIQSTSAEYGGVVGGEAYDFTCDSGGKIAGLTFNYDNVLWIQAELKSNAVDWSRLDFIDRCSTSYHLKN
jgi:hypothetical protein